MDYDYLPLNPFIFDTQYESPQINRTDDAHEPKPKVVEDRRRRNTEASARFRTKKKIREKALENTVCEMTAKSNILEHRIKELEVEANWLRNLLMEKDQFDVAFL